MLVVQAGRCSMTPVPAVSAPVTPVPLERLAPGPGSYTYYSGIDGSLRVVIRDATRWREYWQMIHQREYPQPPLPAVDFARRMVLLVAAGRRPSGGYTIRIESAADRGGVLAVAIREERPGHGCILTAAISTPVDLALVAVRDSVRFSGDVAVQRCE